MLPSGQHTEFCVPDTLSLATPLRLAEIDYPVHPGQYLTRPPDEEWRKETGMDIRKITDELSVAPQIGADDVSAIAAAGFRAVICNRPDGEASDQPCCQDIEAAVKASGLAWRMQPVRSGGVTQADADAFGELMAELPKPVLAYCRSGTRCAALWCLSETGKRPLSDILDRARAAGYDMAAAMRRAMGPGV